MKLGLILLSLAFTTLVPGAVPEPATPSTVARWHFVGGDALQRDTRAPQLKAALTTTNALGLGGRLSTNLARFVSGRLGGPTDARADSLAPLVQTFLSAESVGNISPSGWSIAVRATGPAAALVREGLSRLPQHRAQVFSDVNGWLVAGSDRGSMTATTVAISKPATGLLSGSFHLPLILGHGPDLFPQADLTLTTSNNAVRTSARLTFSRPPLGELGDWKIPTDIMRDPLVRFMAVRGAAPLIARLGWIASLAGGTPPNQVIGWAQPEVPFRNWFTFPVDQPLQRIAQVRKAANPLFGDTNHPGIYEGRLVVNSNRSAVAAFGLKACLPMLATVQQQGQDFLVASFVPGIKSTNPVPAELLAEIRKPDLAAYEWEITGESAKDWNILFEFNQLAQRHPPFPVRALAHRWMISLTPNLGNSITRVTRRSPTEYDFARKSDIGLDGLELVLLTRWMDAAFGLAPQVAPPLPPALPLPKNRP